MIPLCKFLILQAATSDCVLNSEQKGDEGYTILEGDSLHLDLDSERRVGIDVRDVYASGEGTLTALYVEEENESN
jgi:hypothetical protein